MVKNFRVQMWKQDRPIKRNAKSYFASVVLRILFLAIANDSHVHSLTGVHFALYL
jgi:hypothetical protein